MRAAAHPQCPAGDPACTAPAPHCSWNCSSRSVPVLEVCQLHVGFWGDSLSHRNEFLKVFLLKGFAHQKCMWVRNTLHSQNGAAPRSQLCHCGRSVREMVWCQLCYNIPPWGSERTSWRVPACSCCVLAQQPRGLLVHFNPVGGRSYLAIALYYQAHKFLCFVWLMELQSGPHWMDSFPKAKLGFVPKAGMKKRGTDEQGPSARSGF